jgi:hypothetical protein
MTGPRGSLPASTPSIRCIFDGASSARYGPTTPRGMRRNG